MNKKLEKGYFTTLITATLMLVGIPVAFAWTAAPSTPPKDNVSAPLNISANDQNKTGKLGLGGLAIFGKLQIIDGTQGVGKVLVSDANGKASWGTPLAGGGVAVSGTGTRVTSGGLVTSGEKNLGSDWDLISITGAYVSEDAAATGGYIYKSGGQNMFAIVEASGLTSSGTLTSTYQCAYTLCVKSSGSDVVIKTGKNSVAYVAQKF